MKTNTYYYILFRSIPLRTRKFSNIIFRGTEAHMLLSINFFKKSYRF